MHKKWCEFTAAVDLLLKGAELVELVNPDLALRPIAVGAALRRLVERVAFGQGQAVLEQPGGRGMRGGAEAVVVHTIRGRLSQHRLAGGNLAVMLDLDNASKTASRSSIVGDMHRVETPGSFCGTWCCSSPAEPSPANKHRWSRWLYGRYMRGRLVGQSRHRHEIPTSCCFFPGRRALVKHSASKMPR